MNKKRPVNLDLTTIKFPIPAIISILHRVSGVYLFIGIGFVVWMLSSSLDSRQGFQAVADVLSGGIAKLVVWITVSAVLYHFVAGIKHLLMDLGIGETKEDGPKMAIGAAAIAAILILLAGVWIWA